MKKSKSRSIPSISQLQEISGESQKQPERFWSAWGSGQRVAAIAVCLFLVAGAMGAGMKYLEESARQQKLNAKNSPVGQNAGLLNSLNPFVEPPLPTATPQLSKEYIYAGSRMLAVEDANASAAPPADLAVWRPSTGYWYVLGGQGSQATSVQWGSSTDITVPGDYDGDGKTDFSVFRPSNGTWYIQKSSDTAMLAYTFGQSGDLWAQADYDGDGKTDAAVFRPSTGYWYIQRSSDGALVSQAFGISTDIPAPADYDGDGKADIGVWRGGATKTFYALRSTNGALQTQAFTADGDPVSADYDGDGKADFAVKSGNIWTIQQSSTNTSVAVTWQTGNDWAVQNDYDGDGKVDIAIWKESTGNWFIRQSSHIGQTNELRQVAWGQALDIPVPAFYRR